MDRRSFLSLSSSKRATPMPPSGLEPYTGPWTEKEAAHLLRRTTFGANFKQIKAAVNKGMSKSLDELLSKKPFTDKPLNYDFDGDAKVPIGETWVDKAPGANILNNNYRNNSLFAWNLGRLIKGEINIREKMLLFWHNHFVVSDINNDARYYYKYIDTLNQNYLGNFKTLVEQITIDPAMLRYLNGNQNTKKAPNENYARELLELFTIGKGPVAGPGDYTNYTEKDILEIAKVLTGWRDVGYRNPNVDVISSIFRLADHETSDKTLSHRFQNAVIKNAGNEEYKVLISIIFRQEEVSKFISRKLYRWFVHSDIDQPTEANVIIPMAKLIRDNQYEILPALRALLQSQHFYDKLGCMIKSPIDLMVMALNQNNLNVENLDLAAKYNSWLVLHRYSGLIQMKYFDAPDVAGWKAYYQEPSYYKTWINSVTLPHRRAYTDVICTSNTNLRGIRIDIDVLSVIKDLSNPKDLETLINDLATVFFVKGVSDNQMKALKEVANPGLPDYEWTIEYEDYLANPNNAIKKKAVENKLRALFTYMMRMPEYQLA